MLPLASTLLYAAAIVMFVGLHRGDRLVDWVRDRVSSCARGSRPRLFQTYVNVGTVAAVLLALQLASSTAPPFPRVVLVSMAIMVFARIGVVAVPTDTKRQRTTRTGRLHLLFAIVSFAATYTAIANATPRLAASAGFFALQMTSPGSILGRWRYAEALLSLQRMQRGPARID